jgi:hypothetical protein
MSRMLAAKRGHRVRLRLARDECDHPPSLGTPHQWKR